MTEYEITRTQQDFLLLNYSNLDFIVNRSQFTGSTSLNGIRQIKSPLPYIDRIFSYNNRNVLLFDCDSFLKETYQCHDDSSSHLCLLIGMENFSERIRPLVEKMLGGSKSLSREYLGLIITAHSEIKKISVNEIHLSPQGVRTRLKRNGLYGCRFQEENRIQHFIDLEIIIGNIIRGRKR